MAAEAVTVAVSIAGGFGAALAGAWYGGRITLSAAREAAERDEARRRQEEIVMLRAAARLVREQLAAVAGSIRGVLEDRYWRRETALDEEVWAAHSGVIARLLDEDEWHAVSRAVAAARRHDALTETFGGPTHTKPEVDDVLRDQQAELQQGMDVLHRYITLGALTDGPVAPR